MQWQSLKEYGLNIFKKRTRSRTLWIGGSLSIFSVIALIFLLTGITVTYTGDIYCENECVSYFNVTSTYWRICFADDFELIQTYPDVPVDVYVPARGKDNWRLFDHTKDCIERKNKYNYLPNRFKIVGHKSAEQTIKWSVDKFDIDPLWIGEESKLETIQDCWLEYWNTSKYIYDIKEVYHSINNSYANETYLKDIQITKYNKTVCKTVFYKYENKVFNASEWCCYGTLCGLIKDYDCNWIKEGRVASGHSYKRLDTGKVKIDDIKLKKHYYKEKEKLKDIEFE